MDHMNLPIECQKLGGDLFMGYSDPYISAQIDFCNCF